MLSFIYMMHIFYWSYLVRKKAKKIVAKRIILLACPLHYSVVTSFRLISLLSFSILDKSDMEKNG